MEKSGIYCWNTMLVTNYIEIIKYCDQLTTAAKHLAVRRGRWSLSPGQHVGNQNPFRCKSQNFRPKHFLLGNKFMLKFLLEYSICIKSYYQNYKWRDRSLAKSLSPQSDIWQMLVMQKDRAYSSTFFFLWFNDLRCWAIFYSNYSLGCKEHTKTRRESLCA